MINGYFYWEAQFIYELESPFLWLHKHFNEFNTLISTSIQLVRLVVIELILKEFGLQGTINLKIVKVAT